MHMKTMTCLMWTKELVILTRINFHFFLDNVKFSLKLSRYMIEDLRVLRCRLVPSVTYNRREFAHRGYRNFFQPSPCF